MTDPMEVPIVNRDARYLAEKHGVQGIAMALHILCAGRQLKINELEQQRDELLKDLQAVVDNAPATITTDFESFAFTMVLRAINRLKGA